MKNASRILALCLATTVTAISAKADSSGTISLTLDGSFTLAPDGMTLTVNTPPADGYQARIGEYFAPGARIYEIAYQLPFILPDGEAFVGAGTSLRMQLFGKGDAGALGNVDLYGLSVRDMPTILDSDFYIGPSDTAPGVTLLQDNFLTPSTPLRIDPNNGFVTTTPEGNDALAAFLNSQWADGANAGKYVFLRFSYDIAPIPEGNNFYAPLTQEAGGANEKPLFSYSTAPVPEPGTVVLLIASGLGLFILRRRKT